MSATVDLAPNVPILTMQDLRAGERRQLERLFHDQIFPLLTPLAIDPTFPLPAQRDGTLLVCCAVSDRLGDLGDDAGGRQVVAAGSGRDLARLTARPAVVPLPTVVDRMIGFERNGRQVAVGGDEIVREHVGRLFPGLAVVQAIAMRIHAPAGDDAELIDLRERRRVAVTVTSWEDADAAAAMLCEVADLAEVRLVASLHRRDPLMARRPRQMRTRGLA